MNKRTTILAMLAASAALSATPLYAKSLPTGACINTGNHLETGGEAAWGGKKLDAGDFANIRSAGYETIRMPVNWSKHIADDAGNRVDPKWMAIVQARVDEALASGLKVILNSHNFDLVHKDPAKGGPMLANVWAQVAAHFAKYPEDRLWFEIENEPHDQLTNANLWQTLAPSLAAMRKTNPTRPVIVGGEKWSGIDSLAILELPNDPNLYPTFHYYDPFDFTHQGASWVGDPPPALGRKYGSEADQKRLRDDVDKIKRYIARTGITPFMGENGAYDIIPLAERVPYHRAVADAFREVGITPCTWAYTNTFPFYDHDAQTWHPGLREASGVNVPLQGGDKK